MKKLLAIILSTMLVMSVFTGCNDEPTKDPTNSTVTEIPTIRLGTFNSRIGFVTWYIMENGLDVANGFKLEVITSTVGGSVLNESIGAGLLDATLMGAPAGVYTAAVYGGKIIAEISEGNGGLNLFARADSEEAKVIDALPEYPGVRGSKETLMGKEIMYPFGSMGQFGVAAYLKAFDLTLEDVKSVNIGFGPGYQALQAGEGDITCLFSPLNYQAINDGYVKLMSLNQLNVPVRDMLMVPKETYEDPKMMDAVKAYLKVLFEYNDKFGDKDFQLEHLVDYHSFHGTTITDPTLLTIEYEDMYLLSTEKAKAELDNMGKSCLAIAEFYEELGIVEADAVEAVANSVDKSIMEEILK